MKTVKLLGIDWLTENLKDEQGNQYFRHEEALSLARDKGVRLPTKKEIDALRSLPSLWDRELKGRWFAENEYDLKNPKKSLFFPAAGIRGIDASLYSVGSNGYYWSSTVNGVRSYYLYFYSCYAYPANYDYRAFGLSVRCILKNN